jgi:hypothetical protein
MGNKHSALNGHCTAQGRGKTAEQDHDEGAKRCL